MASQRKKTASVPSSTRAYKRNAAAYRKQRKYARVPLRSASSRPGKVFRVRGGK